jgi:hypothetical protein
MVFFSEKLCNRVFQQAGPFEKTLRTFERVWECESGYLEDETTSRVTTHPPDRSEVIYYRGRLKPVQATTLQQCKRSYQATPGLSARSSWRVNDAIR